MNKFSPIYYFILYTLVIGDFFLLNKIQAQGVGINATGAAPNSAAMLHVDVGTSTSKGLLITGTSNGTSTIPSLGAGSRFMFYPGKSAFRAGQVDGTQWDNSNVGYWSTALGHNTKANGDYSTAIGFGTIASGSTSTAIGENTIASGSTSTAIGASSTASGNFSTAIGFVTTASGNTSTAMGINTTASGIGSTAMGSNSTAFGDYSFAAGKNIQADLGSFVFGDSDPYSTPLSFIQNAFGARFSGGYYFAMPGAGSSLKQINFTSDGSIHVPNGDIYCYGYFQSYFSAVGGYLKLYRDNSNNAIWISSDKRLKKDITTVSSALSKLDKLNAVTWNWNSTGYDYLTRDIQKMWTSKSGTKEDNEKLWAKVKADELKKLSVKQYGFIAQDVEKVFPDWVKEEDGYKQIKTDQLLPVLVQAIKELRDQKEKEIKALRNEKNTAINKLKAEIAHLKSSLRSQTEVVTKRMQKLELLVQGQTIKTNLAKK